jgi:hypothetical protein
MMQRVYCLRIKMQAPCSPRALWRPCRAVRQGVIVEAGGEHEHARQASRGSHQLPAFQKVM